MCDFFWQCLTKLLGCDPDRAPKRQDTWRIHGQRWTGRPIEQQASQYRLHNNDFFSTVQPACLLICGRGWLRDNVNLPCAAEKILHERILLPWQERGRKRWRRLSNDREAVLQPKKRRGFIHLQSEKKQGIIDESAAYNFQYRIKQTVKLHCRASSNGDRPSMR